jgi:hypothetical protein
MANSVLLILLSLILAIALSYFQYFYKIKNTPKINYFLAVIRFFLIFGILLLLINPILTRKTFEIQKTPLPIIVDNSSSIVDLKAKNKALEIFNKITSNEDLQEKFDIATYQFDTDFQASNEFDFKGKQSNLETVSKNLKSIYKNRNFPTILISDGNQTAGNDYVTSFEKSNPVYPVILGDTTTFFDLKIKQINVNKYAFYKNKFPVEIFLNYSGTKSCISDFVISQGSTILEKQSISFSPSNKSVILSVLLPASAVGLQVFKASLVTKISEKNTYNNSKAFAVQVLDQKTNIAIISETNHPDVGAIKRSIEQNAQRKVTILKPKDSKLLQDYSVLILYQPTADFKSVFESNKIANCNTWIITGTETDYEFLNQQQDNLTFKMSSQSEDYLADYNPDFSLFSIENIGFDNFPPLKNNYGIISKSNNTSVLLASKIRNIPTNFPLLAYAENQGKRSAYLLGENIWKWRFQSHIDQQSFDKFDIFIDKTIQFLATNNSKKSLIVNHENVYYSGESISVEAQYFNKNYEFDERARLTISVTNRATKEVKNFDFLKGNNNFKVNLDGLNAGKYTFNVKELNANDSYNGYFEVLDFDIEKQFVNPDVLKLKQLASKTNGIASMPNQVDALLKQLLSEKKYIPIQKAIIKKTPLIDYTLLLVLLIFLLGIEWFTRKYNGML